MTSWILIISSLIILTLFVIQKRKKKSISLESYLLDILNKNLNDKVKNMDYMGGINSVKETYVRNKILREANNNYDLTKDCTLLYRIYTEKDEEFYAVFEDKVDLYEIPRLIDLFPAESK